MASPEIENKINSEKENLLKTSADESSSDPSFSDEEDEKMARKRKTRAVVNPGQIPLEEYSPSPKRFRQDEVSAEIIREKTLVPYAARDQEEDDQQKILSPNALSSSTLMPSSYMLRTTMYLF
ncbi:uncharacterized protein LOC110696771 [Chenopodium quinoa]|uniref:uncharacterized protein LOC110696771 n=1 Tax=Chenopodium quinoa TaxID=63459 RepID=UPI000B782CF9|nr:uncharacterized protein LOC110696771 [Chenopodium quinoa]